MTHDPHGICAPGPDDGEGSPWEALSSLHSEWEDRHLRDLFAADPGRAERLTLGVGDLRVDLSKNLIDAEVVGALVALAEGVGLTGRIEGMFRGDRLNTTEDRAVLHTALRAPRGTRIEVDGADVVAGVHGVLDRLGDLAERVHRGEWTGHTGRAIRNVVNIGIGGSDLGPAMAVRGLRPWVRPGLTVRFVSNIDPAQLASALAGLDPAETLFVVVSKTFTTLETLANARTARSWLVAGLGGDERAVGRHFVAASTNAAEVEAFGIDPANMFEFWDWVGGRYSVGSAAGLALMLAVGPEAFGEFLAGMGVVDDHFRSAPLAQNVPALLGLIGVWYRNLFGWATHAVLPYSQDLDRFPAYLQQLDMESNGKGVRRDGRPVETETGPVVWGEPGTNGQHAFYQLLHQGTSVVPADLIGFARNPDDVDGHHLLLVSNLIAQAEALAFGRSAREVEEGGVAPELVPHRTFPGNRPTTVISARELTPSVLGQLIALYEHKVFTQGTVWGINSFDQFGVELGKVLAGRVAAELAGTAGPEPSAHDPSTLALIDWFRSEARPD